MLRAPREFDRDLREHMYKENEALFPRAIEAQGRLAGSSPAAAQRRRRRPHACTSTSCWSRTRRRTS